MGRKLIKVEVCQCIPSSLDMTSHRMSQLFPLSLINNALGKIAISKIRPEHIVYRHREREREGETGETERE